MASPLTRDQILMGSPLRRPGTSKVVCAALIGILVFATIVNLALLAGLGADVLSVFDRALARSTALASVPLSVLWFLDRRERESPLLFASRSFGADASPRGWRYPSTQQSFTLPMCG